MTPDIFYQKGPKCRMWWGWHTPSWCWDQSQQLCPLVQAEKHQRNSLESHSGWRQSTRLHRRVRLVILENDSCIAKIPDSIQKWTNLIETGKCCLDSLYPISYLHQIISWEPSSIATFRLIWKWYSSVLLIGTLRLAWIWPHLRTCVQ